jgi:hypothetical protein
MNTLTNRFDTIEQIIFNENVRITSITVNEKKDALLVKLHTGLTITTPLKIIIVLKMHL